LRRTFQGHPITIGFNSAYLLDVLKTASAGDLGFEFKDGQSAGQLLRTPRPRSV
jgi:DNA polymerase III sliding clamp (beta) subunit (PCNA family)